MYGNSRRHGADQRSGAARRQRTRDAARCAYTLRRRGRMGPRARRYRLIAGLALARGCMAPASRCMPVLGSGCCPRWVRSRCMERTDCDCDTYSMIDVLSLRSTGSAEPARPWQSRPMPSSSEGAFPCRPGQTSARRVGLSAMQRRAGAPIHARCAGWRHACCQVLHCLRYPKRWRAGK